VMGGVPKEASSDAPRQYTQSKNFAEIVVCSVKEQPSSLMSDNIVVSCRITSSEVICLGLIDFAPFPELIDRKKYGKMEWKQKIKD